MVTQLGVWQSILDLLSYSKCRRDQGLTPSCVLTHNGHRFVIELADNINQIKEGHELFAKHLRPQELESFASFCTNLDGILLAGRKTRYRLFLIRDMATRTVVAAHTGFLTSLAGTDDAVFVGTYAATDEVYRGLGLMRELLISALMQAAIDAHAREETLQLVIGECTADSEPTWNATKRRRVYVKIGAGQYREVAYKQPSVRFDPKTGLPTEDAGPVVEHLMVRLFNGHEVSKKILLGSVRAMYEWFCAQATEKDFATPDAYTKYQGHFKDLLAEFAMGLKVGSEDLIPVSAQERARRMEQEETVFE